MENKEHDLIIIGAGPAGLSAAIYGVRAGLEVLMLESSAPGGKMVTTAEIENWPGYKSITGPDLAYSMFDHATSLGAKYQYGHVARIDDVDGLKVITTTNEEVYYTRNVIIATGMVERKLNIPGEAKFANKGVSYCAVCDGAFFKDKIVSVIGGGNSALEEALYLTKFASKVNVIIRRDEFRASQIVQDHLKANEKINLITLSKPIEVIGDTKVTGLVLENVNTNELVSIATDGIFPFIGLDPITTFVEHLGITNPQNYIITDDNMETKVKGLYAAGDVRVKELRQVVTASNDGAIAAQHIASKQ
ncbi:MAG: thioredoxin-disulfide reductase [Bacilli bacterium]